MRGKWSVVLAATMALGLGTAAAPNPSARALPTTFDLEEQAACDVRDWATPAAFATDVIGGEELRLRVHVLVDGARGLTAGRVAPLLTSAAKATYENGIAVRVSFSWGTVHLVGTEGTAEDAFAAAKRATGGRPPAGADLVYLITDQDLSGTLAGQADCVGGIMYPETAFAIGEYYERDRAEPALLSTQSNLTGKIFSHEIGHLLGAHHHYANCIEGIPSDATTDVLSACTLMANVINVASLNFSTVNKSVARGHVRQFG